MSRARVQLVAALLAALAAPVAAGCGDDDEPADTAARQPRTAAQETQTAEATETAPTDTAADEGGEAAGELPDTCALLGADEMRAATGRDVDPREEQGDTVDGFTYRECSWTAIGFEPSAAVRVVSGTRRYDTLLRDLRGAGARISRLSGLGDEAFLASGYSSETRGGSRGSTVFARSGGNTFSIALVNARDEGPREELVSLMERMLERAD